MEMFVATSLKIKTKETERDRKSEREERDEGVRISRALLSSLHAP